MGVELRTTRMTVIGALLRVSTPRPAPAPAPDALAEILARLDAIERRLGEGAGGPPS